MPERAVNLDIPQYSYFFSKVLIVSFFHPDVNRLPLTSENLFFLKNHEVCFLHCNRIPEKPKIFLV